MCRHFDITKNDELHGHLSSGEFTAYQLVALSLTSQILHTAALWRCSNDQNAKQRSPITPLSTQVEAKSTCTLPQLSFRNQSLWSVIKSSDHFLSKGGTCGISMTRSRVRNIVECGEYTPLSRGAALFFTLLTSFVHSYHAQFTCIMPWNEMHKAVSMNIWSWVRCWQLYLFWHVPTFVFNVC